MKQKRSSYRIAYPMEALYAFPLEESAPQPPTKDGSPPIDTTIWQSGMISDISSGGARLHGKLQVPVAAEMKMRFLMPSDFLADLATQRDVQEIGAFGARIRVQEVKPKSFPELTLRCSVVNVSLNFQTRTFVHNLQFVKIRPGDADQIERFINLRQRWELRERKN